MAIQFAYRVAIACRDKSFQLESATRVQKVTPPSAPLEGADYSAGAWFAIEDAAGRTLYRRAVPNPFEGHEVLTDEKQEMRRVQIPGLPTGLSLLVPAVEGGETLSVYASEPPERAAKAKPARRVLAVSMRDLALRAAKAKSTR